MVSLSESKLCSLENGILDRFILPTKVCDDEFKADKIISGELERELGRQFPIGFVWHLWDDDDDDDETDDEDDCACSNGGVEPDTGELFSLWALPFWVVEFCEWKNWIRWSLVNRTRWCAK